MVRSIRILSRTALLLSTLGIASSACGDKAAERIDLTRYLEVDPGRSIVGLRGKTAKLRVSVRNVSHLELRKLRLEVKSEACDAAIAPATIALLNPGERVYFSVSLARRAKVTVRRYPLYLTLRGEGLPVAAGLDLIVDLRGPARGGWIDVGQVKLVHRSSSRLSYYLLGTLPLLLLLGWLLHRVARRRKPRGRGGKTAGNRR